MRLRHIQQPGPDGPQRIIAHPVLARAVDVELPRGVSLLAALHALAQAHGAEGGCLTLSGGALGPFAYVIPALAPDPQPHQDTFLDDTLTEDAFLDEEEQPFPDDQPFMDELSA